MPQIARRWDLNVPQMGRDLSHQSQALTLSEEIDSCDTAEEITGAANKFLASLEDGQRSKVVFDFKDEAQRMGGDPTKHIHTIYRDPSNDYGAMWWKR